MKRINKSNRIVIIVLVFFGLVRLPFAVDAKTSRSNSMADMENCGCELKPLPDVVATVNGAQIHSSEILEPLKDQIAEIQKPVIDARRVQLDQEINIRLLEDEAKKRGVTPTKLVQMEIKAKVQMPTDAEVKTFFDENRSTLQGEFKDIKEGIADYIRGEREQKEAERFAYRLRSTGQMQVLVAEVTPPKSPSDRSRVMATVNGKQITSGDIEDSLRPLVFSVQVQVFGLIVDSVSLIVNDRLLQQEAKKRQTTPKAVLDVEVDQKTKKVTDDDARKYYEQNKTQIPGDFNTLKPQIVQYLQGLETEKAAEAFVERLRQGSTIQSFLVAPDPPTYTIATDDRPTKGAATAPVTLIEFTDYQCPDCARAQPIIEATLAKYSNSLRVVIRNFPLAKHNNALKAAEAAEAARAQGKYWEYVTVLFQNQAALSVDNLKTYATKVGLDRKQFDAALDSGQYSDRVQIDLMDGQKIGVAGTPSVFVNGRPVFHITAEGLSAAIDATLKNLGKK